MMSEYTYAAYVWSSIGALGLVTPLLAVAFHEARGRASDWFCRAAG